MTIIAKYRAYLRNNQGCIFDRSYFSSLQALRSWARDRGGNYELIIELNDGSELVYQIRNNRIYVAD